MDILFILKVIAAMLTIATGLLALIKPSAVPGFTGLSYNGPRDISEVRSIFGGLFIALGSAPFLLGEAAFVVLGLSYLGIAVVRLFSIFFDKSKEQSNLISLGIEIVLGIILIL
ncbi:MAG: hypothetical protein CVU41_14115 [Chloroflexi bacterium HGW-Chloroflexi-3]|nr:MAG: hypothetical protein CVU41_14115 [Chloroflexi bacterium HGW-Chloroflexi-3]